MASITELIKELRERTGAGMLDCKKALEAVNNDISKAIDWLREKGISKAAKKASRVASEGLVFAKTNDKDGVIIELNSETDFVAKNSDFKNFGEKLVSIALDNKLKTVDELKSYVYEGKPVSDHLTELIAKIGENINLRKVEYLHSENGFVTMYIHLGGKIGVLLDVNGEVTEENKEKAKGVTLHIAAMDPKYTYVSEVTAEDLEKEKEIQRKLLLQEGKPEALVDKILTGKMNKFYEENCLEEQKYVRDDKISIKKFLSPLTINKFIRIKVGEGIEKEKVDFAAEVAAQISGK